MRKMLTLLLVAVLHRLDRALAASYFESLAMRQQLAMLNRKTPRPRLHPPERWFWVLITSYWPDWRAAATVPAIAGPSGSRAQPRPAQKPGERRGFSGDRPEFTRRSILSALHGQAAFRRAGSMAAPTPPQDLVGAMARTHDPLSKTHRTGSESGACPLGDRHRPRGLVERRRLAHARRHNQSVTNAMGPPELVLSDSGPVAALLSRLVRSRTHGGVGRREGRFPSHLIVNLGSKFLYRKSSFLLYSRQTQKT